MSTQASNTGCVFQIINSFIAKPHAMEVEVQESAPQLQQQEFLSAGASPFVPISVGGVSAAQRKKSSSTHEERLRARARSFGWN